MIVVRCVDSLAAAAAWRDAAEALNLASPRPDPNASFAHHEVVGRHASRSAAGPQPWLLLAFRGDTLVGHLALRRQRRRMFGVPVTTLGFLAAPDADRPGVVARAEDQAEVALSFWRHLLAHADEWSLLELHQQDRDSTLWPAPPGADFRRHRVCTWPTLENCTVPVRWATLDAYVATLARKFRASLRHQVRELLAAGAVERLASADPAVTPVLLALHLAVERRSWKARAGVHLGGDPQRCAALLDPAQPMRIAVQVLLLDGRPVASLVTGAYAGQLHVLHIAHDEGLGRLGPGSVMMLLGMREAIGGAYRSFNLRSGFGYYKLRWGAELRETRCVQVYRRGSLADWHRRMGDWRRRLEAWRQRRFGVPARDGAPPFNPARRAAAALAALPTPADEVTAWVTTARNVPGTSLAGDALRDVLLLRRPR